MNNNNKQTRVDKYLKRNAPHKSALPPTDKRFWDIWRRKVRIQYADGIDNAAGSTSTKLDPELQAVMEAEIRKKKKKQTVVTPGWNNNNYNNNSNNNNDNNSQQ